jgi:predicted Zn-dependent protease
MIRTFTSIFIIAAFAVACSRNALSNKNQFKLFKESDLQTMSTEQYQQFLSSSKIVSGTTNRDAEMVRRVGVRITKAVEAYYNDVLKIPNALAGFKWEYNLVDNKEVNAWCMPGGKIVVYTGLLPITQNEAALANVMGHEVSHALFGHTNERMSQTIAAQYGGSILDAFMANKSSAAMRNIFGAAVGVGSQVGIMAFGRKQELEADRYGMIWAAMAGYNPQEAIGLWQRMQAQAGSGGTPEFLSTHPGPERRIEQLQKYMPEALKYYKPVGK